MIELVWLLWAGLALGGFARWRGAGAACAVLVTGWALLPAADYEAYRQTGALAQWFDVRGVALAPPVFWTKASVIGLVMLAAMAAFDRARLRSLRVHWADTAMIAWCLVPAASSLAAGLGVAAALQGVLYHALAWGGPYVAGRAYLREPAERAAAARVLVAAGLAYLPLCLLELVRAPFLYSAVYGFHPHQHDGAGRWLGYRPVVLLEHGNALGIWMASLAVVAAGAWWSGTLERVGRLTLPAAASFGIVVALVAVAVLTQSVGPVLLLVAALAVLATARWLRWWVMLAVVIAPLIGYVGFRVVDPVEMRPTLERVLGAEVVERLRGFREARSLAWRVMREEEHAPAVRERPVLGHATWGWWRDQPHAPWSLWMLTLGRYGIVGVVVMVGLFAVPVGVFLYRHPPATWAREPARRLQAALALVLLMSLVDSMLNNTFNVVLIALAGALLSVDQPAGKAGQVNAGAGPAGGAAVASVQDQEAPS